MKTAEIKHIGRAQMYRKLVNVKSVSYHNSKVGIMVDDQPPTLATLPCFRGPEKEPRWLLAAKISIFPNFKLPTFGWGWRVQLCWRQIHHRQFRKAFYLTINVLMFTSALSFGAVGQPGKPLPENAEAGRYGAGWECKRGFRQKDNSCIGVKLPDHAFLTKNTYGKGWDCYYGFAEKGDKCVAVQVPANAYLDPYLGDSWKCLSGYRQSNEACEPIIIPENAFLSETSSSRGWDCERGYRATELACIKVEVPDHAYLTTSGDEWKCDRGFEEKNKACVTVRVPDHAVFVGDSYGQKWKCNRGFEMMRGGCVQIKLPENAHLAYSGNTWECNRPYRLLSSECVIE